MANIAANHPNQWPVAIPIIHPITATQGPQNANTAGTAYFPARNAANVFGGVIFLSDNRVDSKGRLRLFVVLYQCGTRADLARYINGIVSANVATLENLGVVAPQHWARGVNNVPSFAEAHRLMEVSTYELKRRMIATRAKNQVTQIMNATGGNAIWATTSLAQRQALWHMMMTLDPIGVLEDFMDFPWPGARIDIQALFDPAHQALHPAQLHLRNYLMWMIEQIWEHIYIGYVAYARQQPPMTANQGKGYFTRQWQHLCREYIQQNPAALHMIDVQNVPVL